jgi:hypothetical protein
MDTVVGLQYSMNHGIESCHTCHSGIQLGDQNYSSVACDVIAAMLEDVNKRFLVSFFCYIFQHGRHVFVFWYSLRNYSNTRIVRLFVAPIFSFFFSLEDPMLTTQNYRKNSLSTHYTTPITKHN